MRIVIDNKSFEVKTQFSEYLIKDLVWINPLIKNLDYSPKFCIDWLLNASNIPFEVLEVLDLETDLKPLTELSVLGIRKPDMYLSLTEIKGHKKREELATLGGLSIMLGNYNYKQFSLMGQLHDIIAKGKDTEPMQLATMLAVLFGEDFSDKAIEKRASEFMNVDLLTGFSGFFLFQKDLSKYRNYTLVSSQATIMGALRLERLQKGLLKTAFGRFLHTRLQKKGYLTQMV